MRIFNVGKVNFIECIIIENLHSHLSSAHLYFLPFIFREPLSLKIREKKNQSKEVLSRHLHYWWKSENCEWTINYLLESTFGTRWECMLTSFVKKMLKVASVQSVLAVLMIIVCKVSGNVEYLILEVNPTIRGAF